MAVDPRSLPKTIDGFREAWSMIEASWATTFDVAQGTDERLLHTAVNGEWSFIETQRHLVFVTDAWIIRTVLGSEAAYHQLGLPPDHRVGEPDPEVDVSAWGIDVFAVAPFDEVLDVRRDRMGTVHRVLDGLTTDGLQRTCDENPAPGFPPTTVMPVDFCIEVVIGEEWAHRRFATRDLATLMG
jgi:hypothetical protein